MSHADAVGDAIKAAIAAIDDESEDVIRDVWRAVAHELLSASLPRTAEIALSAAQGGLSNGSPIAFNSIAGSLADDSLVSLSSGRVTLVDGHTYRVHVDFFASFNSPDGFANFQIRTPGNSVLTGDSGVAVRHLDLESDSSLSRRDSEAIEFVKTANGADVEFDVDLVSNTRLNQVLAGARIVITEVR